jgi:hypothetical protein
MSAAKITWTKIDEAPALATFALLPVVQAFLQGSGVEVETADISLAGRILANFPDKLRDDQKIPDELSRLGALAQTPEGNIVKLPEHLRLGPAAAGGDRGAAGAGPRSCPDFPEEPARARRSTSRARPSFDGGPGLGGEPGPARGQLRPARGGGGQGVRAQGQPAPDDEALVRSPAPSRTCRSHDGAATSAVARPR